MIGYSDWTMITPNVADFHFPDAAEVRADEPICLEDADDAGICAVLLKYPVQPRSVFGIPR